MSENRRLNAFSLAALLVSAHYGLGFLLGTAEKSLSIGAAGSLYPISISIGAILLVGLVKFYWTAVDPIWTLLGKRYGRAVAMLVEFMIWASLIGIEAVQVISGAFILKVLGAPVLPSMIGLSVVFMGLSLLPIERASRLFQALLVLNCLALIYGLWQLHGLPVYWRSPLEFLPSLTQIPPANQIGIAISTILLVQIDMKCQQFVVRSQSVSSAYWGCLLAGGVLLLLAFLPSSVVVAATNAGILPEGIHGKEVLPFILAWLGGGTHHPLGFCLIMSLLVPALGVGSSVLRVQNKTVLDFTQLPSSRRNYLLVAIANILLSLAVATNGSGSLVNLIVSFYSVYVAAVLVPFGAYLLAQFEIYQFSRGSVRLSLLMSSLSSLAVLVLTLVWPRIALFGNVELSVMIFGMSCGLLGLLTGQLIEKYMALSKVREEI